MTRRENRTVYRFSTYEVHPGQLELRKFGVRVRLRGKPMDALLLLLERPGEIVTREELRKRLWDSDTFVDFEDSLNHAMARLREALDDDPKIPRFIETLAGTGYRFIAHVDQGPSTVAHPAAPSKPGWLWIGAAACVATALVVLLWLNAPPDAAFTETAQPSIAVLPFDSLSGVEDQVFADGVADTLINELAKIRSLRVISRTSTKRYRNPSVPLPDIARDLGATHVIEGSILHEGERVRITAQLIDAGTDENVWADTYEGMPNEVLAFQSRVARQIVTAIQARVTPEEEARLAAARPVRPDVYTTYLSARDAYETGDLDRAVELFEETIKLDPDYAPAYSWLAHTYIAMGFWLGKPDDLLEQADAAALRGQQLDDTLAEPYVLLGRIRAYRDWEWEEAEHHFVKAIELNPSHVPAKLAYALYLVVVNRLDEARRYANEALQIDPLSPSTLMLAAEVFHGARDLDLAISLLNTASALSPEGPGYHVQLGCIYGAKGDYDQSLAHVRQVTNFGGGDVRALAISVWAYAVAGEREKALELAGQLDREVTAEHSSHYTRTYVYGALGDPDRAFELLEAAAEDRWLFLATALTMPPFDTLRPDPRFDQLLERMGLRKLRERNAG